MTRWQRPATFAFRPRGKWAPAASAPARATPALGRTILATARVSDAERRRRPHRRSSGSARRMALPEWQPARESEQPLSVVGDAVQRPPPIASPQELFEAPVEIDVVHD